MKRFSRIYIEITNVCNFNCSFCKKSKREPRTMKVSEFKKVAREVKEYTDLIMLHVKGEPLIHPELGEILDVCYEEGLKVNITTNGSLLLNKIEHLKRLSLRQLNISIHSISQNESEEFNEQEYLYNIFEAVKRLKEYNSNLLISYRLWNLKDISENSINYNVLYALEKEYGVYNLKELASKNNFVELGNGIFLNQDIEFKWPNMEDDIIGDKGRCLGLKNQLGILSDGNVVPCCLDQDANVLLGNVFEDSLSDVLNSEKVKMISNGFSNGKIIPELCKRCTFREKFNK